MRSEIASLNLVRATVRWKIKLDCFLFQLEEDIEIILQANVGPHTPANKTY